MCLCEPGVLRQRDSHRLVAIRTGLGPRLHNIIFSNLIILLLENILFQIRVLTLTREDFLTFMIVTIFNTLF